MGEKARFKGNPYTLKELIDKGLPLIQALRFSKS